MIKMVLELKKFDVKEIEFYCKTRNSVHAATVEIAKRVGVSPGPRQGSAQQNRPPSQGRKRHLSGGNGFSGKEIDP